MDKSTADLKPGPTPDSLSTFDDSSLPNGCVRFHPLHDEVQDDFDAERVGVLDYMPMSRHTTTDASRKSAPVALHRLQIDDSSSPADLVDREALASRPDELKNIELTTFRITECRDRRGLMTCSSCASDDDELLGAEADDYLHEVVVQSSGSSRPLPGDGETAPLLRCIPSSFGATRDRAWSRSDMGCESPSVDDGESVIHDLEEDTFTTFRVSSYEGGCVATTTASGRDDEAVEDRSPLHESKTPVAIDDEKNAEAEMGSTSLPPVEVVSVDRSAMDPSSMSRSNVLYLNDYSLWTNAARAFCREDPASDRSEVEKRQERRDKRRERRGHERTVKAEEIEGYMGMKEVKDLLEYIGGEVEKNKEGMSGRKEMGKASKRGKEVESSATPRPGDTSKSAETPQVKVTSKQKSRTTQKATSSKSPEMGERGKESGLGRDTVSTEGSLSGENAEEGGIPDDKEFSASAKTIEQTELDPSRDISMDLGGTSTRSKSPAPIESIQQSIESLSTAVSDGPTRKPAPRTNEPEQTLGSKKSKKQNSRKNRCAAQGADKTWQDSRGAIGETTSASLGSSPTHNAASNEIRRTSESGNALPADGATSTFSEELMADTTNEDVSQSYRHPYKSVQDRIQDKDRTQDKDRIQDKDDDWTVHMRRHTKQRAKPGDGDNRTSEQNPTVWKDPLGRPPPGYRRPDAPRGSSGRVGSVGDTFQGPKYPLGRGRQGSLNLESGPGRVGSRTFWGNRETKEGAKVLPDTPKDPAGLPKQRACADEGRKEECISYATVAAGELVWPQCLSVEVVGVGGQTSSKPEGADEVSDQIGDEADCPPDDLCSNVKVDPDAGGTGGDIPLQAKTETGDTGLMSTPKEEPRSGTAVISTATKQVSNDTTSSKEIPRSNESPNSKQEDHHSRVPNQGTVITVGIEVTEPETIEKKTMEKKTTENKSTPDQATTKPILSIDKDAINQNLPTPTSQPKRNPKTKALPVEFSRRFKGTRVDDISFCFDPTVVEPKPQGPSSIPALESSQGSGGSISTRLVSGPTHSTTTVVPAGGGLQLQNSGTSAPNCSRPIAPLSGSGHVSGAKTPVVVVNPMQLVARGPAEASQTIVGNDTDPEILKEVMVHTDAVAPMMIFSSKMDDIAGATRADSTRLGVNVPTRPLQLDEDPSTVEDPDLTKCATLVEELPCGSRTETPGSSSLKQGDSQPKPHPDPASLHLSCGDAQIDAPPQQFVHPYVLYRPCVETCPQVVPGVSRQGVVGTPVLDAVLAPPLYQPQSRRDQPWGVRPQMHCAHPSLPIQVAVPAASLVLIQNYIHNEFKKVLEEERRDPTRVIRFREA